MSEKEKILAPKKQRKSLYFYLIALGVFAIIAGVVFYIFAKYFDRYTDDAYVEGNQVIITPLQEGFITQIHTDDTFFVKEGQLLIELDETDAKIALDKSKDELANVVRTICQSYYTAFAYKSDIAIKYAEWIQAKQDYNHRIAVIDYGGVSLEDLEHAEAALKATKNAIDMTKSLYQKEMAYIQGTSISNHPLVQEATQNFINAWVQLYRCKIYSPVDGLAAQRKAQVGMYVDKTTPLLSVIPLDQIWVNANFKETQMKYLRIGQTAKITSDFYGKDVKFHGTIVGISGGAGNSFSLLPPENLSGNWIKIVQRVPVRIALDPHELAIHPLRIGLSMEVTVDINNTSGPTVATLSEKSPEYSTNIYQYEELGAKAVAQDIIIQNVDRHLVEYISEPFLFPLIEEIVESE